VSICSTTWSRKDFWCPDFARRSCWQATLQRYAKPWDHTVRRIPAIETLPGLPDRSVIDPRISDDDLQGPETLPMPERKQMARTPGDVYLCQVSSKVSCGACCGLYNVEPISQEAISAALEIRTRRFQHTARTAEAILKFGQVIQDTEEVRRPYPEFHVCPYLGLVGKNRTRVGCLLHPLGDGNRGVDYRGLSHYGGMACREYFCPAHRKLPAAYAEIVRQSADSWFAYGLLITETGLLNALFRHAEKRLGYPLTATNFKPHASGARLVDELVEFKLQWPFRAAGCPTACHYFFNDRIYSIPRSDAPQPDARRSEYDEVLRSLNTETHSAQEFEAAENLIDGIIEKTASLATRQRRRTSAS
jgi:hypothetical protein